MFDRVLTIDADNAEVLAILDGINRRGAAQDRRRPCSSALGVLRAGALRDPRARQAAAAGAPNIDAPARQRGPPPTIARRTSRARRRAPRHRRPRDARVAVAAGRRAPCPADGRRADARCDRRAAWSARRGERARVGPGLASRCSEVEVSHRRLGRSWPRPSARSTVHAVDHAVDVTITQRLLPGAHGSRRSHGQAGRPAPAQFLPGAVIATCDVPDVSASIDGETGDARPVAQRIIFERQRDGLVPARSTVEFTGGKHRAWTRRPSRCSAAGDTEVKCALRRDRGGHRGARSSPAAHADARTSTRRARRSAAARTTPRATAVQRPALPAAAQLARSDELAEAYARARRVPTSRPATPPAPGASSSRRSRSNPSARSIDPLFSDGAVRCIDATKAPDAARARGSEAAAEAERAAQGRSAQAARVIVVYEARPLYLNFVPFGVGQFQNGARKGVFFARAESVTLIASVGDLRLPGRHLRHGRPSVPQDDAGHGAPAPAARDRDRARVLRALACSASIDAIRHYKPQTRAGRRLAAPARAARPHKPRPAGEDRDLSTAFHIVTDADARRRRHRAELGEIDALASPHRPGPPADGLPPPQEDHVARLGARQRHRAARSARRRRLRDPLRRPDLHGVRAEEDRVRRQRQEAQQAQAVATTTGS